MRGAERTLAIEEIVEAGLCIGCGLCESIAGRERLRMVMTPEGRERPLLRAPLPEETLRLVNAVCPGTRISGADERWLAPGTPVDPVWGPATRLVVGHATNPVVRYRGATGGVLTALGQHLLDNGEAEYIVHVGASREHPMRSARALSFDSAQVLEAAGSRYGPAAPLVDFRQLLDRGRPFAFIGKPCDVAAVRNLARHDPRVARLMRAALALVCGGASELGKSREVLEAFGLAEDEVVQFRYRGHGNPGPTRIQTRDGRAFELTYLDMWADEAGWRIQARCKICPDAIGEAADIAASDVWPGGAPDGEDEGFNGILVRTGTGLRLFESACASGALTVVRDMCFRDMDRFQPHQVRKKRAVWARLAGMRAAGLPVPRVTGLRLAQNARANGLRANLAEARGARRRTRAGRLGEVPVRPEQPEPPQPLE